MFPAIIEAVHPTTGGTYTYLFDSCRVRLVTGRQTTEMSPASPPDRPLFGKPVLWAIRLLSLIAVAVSGYLVYTTFGHTTVAGCDGTGAVDCSAVFGTAWSKWLGLPVAVGGLACYASLLVLSLLTGWRQPTAARWIPTLLVMLAIVAAGAGLWFAALQLLVVHKLCLYCMGVHLTGITIAALVLWSVLRHQPGRPSASHRVAVLAAVMPTSAPRVPVASRQTPSGPSLPWALSGAGFVLALLVGGQLMSPADTYEIGPVTLDESIDMSESPSITAVAQSTPSDAAQTHVVHRLPTDDVASAEAAPNELEPTTQRPVETRIEDPQVVPTASIEQQDSPALVEPLVAVSEPTPQIQEPQPDESATPPVEAKARPERKVSFLNDTLTIDTYDNAVIGSPEAPYVVVELMDYTCPHCRVAQEAITKARRKYGDKLAIVVMPVPLEHDCNKYMPVSNAGHKGACKLAGLALSVWTIKPSAFARYHDWLLADKDNIPPVNKAIIQAFDLVDGKQLRALSESGEVNARIARDVELYVKLSKKRKSLGLPVQIVGNKILSGEVSTDKMSRTWEKELGVEPR